ncbi:MAG: hypothetical protein ACI9XB_004349 [Gammaproteobacteria bacterium]|jgi:hypothetical protein
MKILKLLSLLIALAIIQSCNPLDSDIDELGLDNNVVSTLDYTLTDDDYDLVSRTYGTFSNVDSAKFYIPQVLTTNYPQFGNGSAALVTYDYYTPVRINNELEAELTQEDYDALGETFGTLSSDGDILDATEYKFPTPENNDLVSLTYEWYCGGCADEGTRTSKVTYYDESWYVAYAPTSDDYTFMGQSFPNFDSRSEGRANIGKLLDTRYIFDEEGTIRTSVFTYTFKDDDDVRQFVDFMTVYQFDGANWQPFNDVVQSSLKLGHDGVTWVPDNTIKYTLGSADYDAIAEATLTSNPDGSASISQYGNFDLGLWTSDEIFAAITTLMLDLVPQVEEQQYLVTYDTYSGASGTGSIHIVFKDGAYALVE